MTSICARSCRATWARKAARLMSDASQIQTWIVARAGAWRNNVQNIASWRTQRSAGVADALRALEAYRGLARDLATARRVAPGSRTTAGLETLYGQLHALINRKPRGGTAALLELLSTDIPEGVREMRPRIAGMVLLMVLSALAGWWLIAT